MQSLFLYAHRGASAQAPENTLAAFRAAIDAGADGVELDVHLTADDVPVVIHDDTLERTTNGAGAVAEAVLGAMRELDAGGWFAPEFAGEPVPTLEEALELLAGRVRINVEIKEYRAGLAVVRLLARFSGADLVISSFDHNLLADLRREAPVLPLALLFEESGWRRALVVAEQLGACAVHPPADLTDRLLIAACRRRRLPVYPWTVDTPSRARSLARSGSSGLFTNDPAGLRILFPAGAV